MHKYWKKEDLLKIDAATMFGELFYIALEIIKRMPGPIGMVSGPITSGGEGSVEKNLAIFSRTIKLLSLQGKNIFDQLPFENSMHRIMETSYYNQIQKGNDHLLETFYLPLFKSKLITAIYFMNTWQTSYGAKWEHDQALELKMEIVYL